MEVTPLDAFPGHVCVFPHCQIYLVEPSQVSMRGNNTHRREGTWDVQSLTRQSKGMEVSVSRMNSVYWPRRLCVGSKPSSKMGMSHSSTLSAPVCDVLGLGLSITCLRC